MQKFLLILMILFSVKAYSQDSGSLLERAVDFYENKEYGMALAVYDSLLNMDPANPDYLENIADIYLHLGNINEALKFYRKANQIEPNNPAIIFRLASIFDNQQVKDSALLYFNRYISLKPDDPNAYNRLAIIYLDMEGYEDSAVAYTKKAIQIDPDELRSYYVNAMAYLSLQQPVDAIFASKAGLAIDSTYSLLYIPLGLGYFYRNDYYEANRYFETGLEYAVDKSLFIDYAVQSRLLDNTDSETMNMLSISEIRFKDIRSRNLNSLMEETRLNDSPYYYPDLVKKFYNNPLEFGLDEFFMLYIGFTEDKNYSAYSEEKEMLEQLLEGEKYGNYLEEGRKYLIENPADFPFYLNMAAISEYLGISDDHYRNLYCYYGFLKAITATGDGNSMENAMIVTYLTHEYTIASELGYSVKSNSLIEQKKEVYDKLILVNKQGMEKELYFNISIPYRWLDRAGKKK